MSERICEHGYEKRHVVGRTPRESNAVVWSTAGICDGGSKVAAYESRLEAFEELLVDARASSVGEADEIARLIGEETSPYELNPEQERVTNIKVVEAASRWVDLVDGLHRGSGSDVIVTAASAAGCMTCGGSGVIPLVDPNGEPNPKSCPDCIPDVS